MAGLPFIAVRRVLRDLTAQFGTDGVLAAAGDSAAVLSALLPQAPGTEWPVEAVAANGEQLLQAVIVTLEALSRRRPLLIIFEDVQWADAATVSFLAAMGVVDSIQRRCDGVPFFVEELVALGADAVDQLTDTLCDVLLARYDRLDETAQRVLRTLSVGGTEVPHALLEEVLELPDERLEQVAWEALAAGVLVAAGDDYTFRHALFREAIADLLQPGERVAVHRRYAEVLSAHDDAPVHAAEIAQH